MTTFYKNIAHQNILRAASMSYEDKNPSDEKKEDRVRMTKQIAEYLLEQYGPLAYTHALDKVETESQPQMWRDVLAWLDDINKESSNVDNISKT